MAYFKLGAAPRKYFSQIEKNSRSGKFRNKLQQYWLCALAGILYGKVGSADDGKDLVERFIEPMDRTQHEIRALLFWRYATDRSYAADDSEDLMRAFKEFFDSDAPSRLGSQGQALLDCYAAGGFEIIRDRIRNPNDLAAFLVDYANLLSDAPPRD